MLHVVPGPLRANVDGGPLLIQHAHSRLWCPSPVTDRDVKSENCSNAA